MTNRLRVALAATLLGAASGGYFASHPPGTIHAQDAPPQPTPTFRAEANYVRVDVFPTINGVPVPDLRQDEFEVLDNGVPQKIEQFERVQVRAAGSQETRIEPNTVRESRAMLQDSRARVFVLFLDTYHVEIGGSHNIRAPLVKALDRIIGPDDLVGVMTPEMSASDVTFARRTTTIDGFLTRYWYWGERERLIPVDPEDSNYYACYPGIGPTSQCKDDDRGIAAEMIERRREKMTLDALADLVGFLRGVREERKAVLAISDGWRLYRPDPTLARQLYCQAPAGPQIGIDPRSGKPTTRPPTGPTSASMSDCDRDRMNLSQIDDDVAFRRLLDEANRANASFYPIDPRGLAVFDTPIAPVLGPSIGSSGAVVPPSIDSAMLQTRINSLRTLAEATDGLAIVNSNNLEGGLQRVVNDLTSYYLLGYYSSTPLDGRFHSIKVRVKRPGVQVRARRGYLAASTADVTRAAAAPSAAPPTADTILANAAAAAVAPLAVFGRELPLWAQATAGWRPGPSGAPAAAFWAVAELTGSAQPAGDVDATVSSASGAIVASGRATGGARSVLVALSASAPIEPGDYIVRLRVPGLGTTTVRLSLPPAPQPSGAVLFRRGPSTGNREIPAADLRFRRSERVRVDLPTPQGGTVDAHLLDRTGKALAIPLSGAVRDDPDGSRWQTVTLALAPLASGDYIVQFKRGSDQQLVAFRVVP